MTFAMFSGFPIRLFLLLFSPVALLILAGAWFIGHDRIEGELGLIKASEISNVVMGVRRLDDELATPLRQLTALKHEISGRIAATNRPGVWSEDFREVSATAFTTLANYNRDIDKVRWIDLGGRERIRVERQSGHVHLVSEDRLQDQVESYYFQAAKTLPIEGFYLSPLDLNVEYGKVETPYKPVLRLATRVQDGNGTPGDVLVMNIAAQSMLDAFHESVVEARDHAMLVNSDGFWLASPDSNQNWGFALPHQQRFSSSFPEIWKVITSMPAGQETTDDGLWTWSTVYPLQVGDSPDVANLRSWFVIAHLPNEQLALVRNRAWAQAGTIGGVLLFLFGWATAWLVRAQQGRHAAEIDAAKAHVEAEAAIRVRELLERFRLIVEANSNGFLVVDNDARIILSNAALESMFGYSRDELLGQRLDMLLPENERRLHGVHLANYMSAPKARPMGMGRDLHGRRKDGSVFPIEVSLSPFTEHGKQYVDALIADISARKLVNNGATNNPQE